MGVSTSPAQSCHHRSTPSRRVDDVPTSLQSSKVPAHRNLLLVHLRTTAQRLKALQSHSLRANPLHNTSQSVLRAKDMITMLLYGLEVFLSMCGKSSNSSNLQMAGGCHIYRPPSRGAVAPTSAKICVPSDEAMPLHGVASVHAVTHNTK